jgi:quercetin dioxygenase-like cupin family protein
MEIPRSDTVFRIHRGATPNYNRENPVNALLKEIEGVRLAAEREHYLAPSIQYLLPFTALELYGPAGVDYGQITEEEAAWQSDPRNQENKNDFQKQNIRRFLLGNVYFVRGYVRAGNWTGPFLHIAYNGGPDSTLSRAAAGSLGPQIRCYIRAAGAGDEVELSYNPETDRYEVELWGYPGDDIANHLDARGAAALNSGALRCRPDMVPGHIDEFSREALAGVHYDIREYAPYHTMHPVRPLPIEVAFSDHTRSFWDSQGGANYHYEFSMLLRGWNNYLAAGASANPHGGVGYLEFRNLFSNYFGHSRVPELHRDLQPWNQDAQRRKPPESPEGRENFMAVEYMDLHVVQPGCGIGIHRHRDNQEAFLLMQGQALMITGDWCQIPQRERAFEVRTMQAGDVVLLKSGGLHALVNTTEENNLLFMFGGYD